MAEILLTNIGDFTAEYGDEDIDFSTNTVTTTLIDGITAVKTADKEFWVNGALTYTITLTNTTGVDLETVVFTDQLNTANITLDQTTGVRVNGVVTPFTYAAGLLTVNVGTVGGAPVTITFQVLRV